MHKHQIEPAQTDPFDDLAKLDRRHQSSAWVMANMVSSIDGATALDGVSDSLGGPGDLTTFQAIRDLSDVIIVGAATVEAEQYRPPRPESRRQARRTDNGAAPAPTIAMVSRSLTIDIASQLFSDPTQRPIILTSESANEERRQRLSEVADVIVVGEHNVTPRIASSELFARGYQVQLVEGGPRVLGQFIESQLIDEFFMTLAPKLAGGASSRIAVGADPQQLPMDLVSVFQDESELYLRYLRSRTRLGSQHDPKDDATPQ